MTSARKPKANALTSFGMAFTKYKPAFCQNVGLKLAKVGLGWVRLLSRALLESTKWWILIRRRGRIHNSFVVLFPLRACLLLVLMKPPALLAASKMPTADAAIDATTQTLWRTI
jgi:hypothetical protein